MKHNNLPAWPGMHKGAINGAHMLVKTTSCVIGLEAYSKAGNWAQYWKPCQLSRTVEVMGLQRESTMTSFLDLCNSILHHKSYLYTMDKFIILKRLDDRMRRFL